MQKTIYVSSQEIWDSVFLKAKAKGLSISEYLLGGNHANWDQLDRIESKLDLLIPKGMPKSLEKGRKLKEVPGDGGVSGVELKKLQAAQEGAREKYKRLNPKSRCMECQKFNRDCVCE